MESANGDGTLIVHKGKLTRMYKKLVECAPKASDATVHLADLFASQKAIEVSRLQLLCPVTILSQTR